MFPWEYHNAINKGLLSRQTVSNVPLNTPPPQAKDIYKGLRGAAKRREGPQILKNKAILWWWGIQNNQETMDTEMERQDKGKDGQEEQRG